MADEGQEGREGRVFSLWESVGISVLDEKRMTGESVNFRLNQMDFVAFILLLACIAIFQNLLESLGISYRRFESCLC